MMKAKLPAIFEKHKDIAEKEFYLERLSETEKIFVEAFVSTNSIIKAANIAGIPRRQAMSWIRSKPKIQKAIAYAYDIVRFRHEITEAYFIEKLKEIVENDKTKPNDKVAALQLLAKLTGYLVEVDKGNKQAVLLMIGDGKTTVEVGE